MLNRSSSKAEVQGYHLFACSGEVEKDSGYCCWYSEVFGPDGGFMPTDYLCKSLEAQAYAEMMMKAYGKYLGKPMPIDVKPIGESPIANRSSNRGKGPKEHDANLTAYHIVQQATAQAEKEEPPEPPKKRSEIA